MKKIKIQIKNRYTGSILFEYEQENNTIKDTIEKAIKNSVDLIGANLRGTDLRGAYLGGANLGELDYDTRTKRTTIERYLCEITL